MSDGAHQGEYRQDSLPSPTGDQPLPRRTKVTRLIFEGIKVPQRGAHVVPSLLFPTLFPLLEYRHLDLTDDLAQTS